MTNPTLERAARAAAEEAKNHDLTYSFGHDNGAYQAIARAVLMAVREPDDAMQRAFWSSPNSDGYKLEAPGLPDDRGVIYNEQEWYGTGEHFCAGYRAMIDAILGEGEGE